MKTKRLIALAAAAAMLATTAVPAQAASYYYTATKTTDYYWSGKKWVKNWSSKSTYKSGRVTKRVYTSYSNGKKSSSSTNTYSYKKGYLSKETYKSGDYSGKTVYTRDKKNRLTKTKYYQNGTLTNTTSYTYKKGKLYKTVEKDAVAKLKTSETVYTINSKGYTTKEVRTSYSYNDKKKKTGSTKYTRTYKYDSKGRITKETGKSDNYSWSRTYSYKKGNLVKEVYKEGEIKETTTFTYNSKGRQTQRKYVEKDNGKTIYTSTTKNTKWDSHGNVTAYTDTSKYRDGSKSTYKYKVSYKYKSGRVSSQIYQRKGPNDKKYVNTWKYTYSGYKKIKIAD